MLRHLRDLYWWLFHRLLMPCNRIRIRSLSPDWHDRDEIMLHACFQLLVEWVENEHGLRSWEPQTNDMAAYCELDRLYFWWTISRPKEQAAQSWSLEREHQLGSMDQVHLERLIKYREYLWT